MLKHTAIWLPFLAQLLHDVATHELTQWLDWFFSSGWPF